MEGVTVLANTKDSNVGGAGGTNEKVQALRGAGL